MIQSILEKSYKTACQRAIQNQSQHRKDISSSLVLLIIPVHVPNFHQGPALESSVCVVRPWHLTRAEYLPKIC